MIAFVERRAIRLTYNESNMGRRERAGVQVFDPVKRFAHRRERKRGTMIISIGSDHAGFDQKSQLADFLISCGHDVIDRGPETGDRVDYPDFAVLVARDVADGIADRGVLVCGTGIGMAMAADKMPGIRAANIVTPEFAVLCREHNDANIVTLSGRFVSLEENQEILRAFLTTEFGGGRHAQRVAKIMEMDRL